MRIMTCIHGKAGISIDSGNPRFIAQRSDDAIKRDIFLTVNQSPIPRSEL